MARLKELRIPQGPLKRRKTTAVAKASLTIDLPTARLVRQVKRADCLDLTTLVDRMLVAYCRQHHPDWSLVTENPPVEAPPVQRRTRNVTTTRRPKKP